MYSVRLRKKRPPIEEPAVQTGEIMPVEELPTELVSLEPSSQSFQPMTESIVPAGLEIQVLPSFVPMFEPPPEVHQFSPFRPM